MEWWHPLPLIAFIAFFYFISERDSRNCKKQFSSLSFEPTLNPVEYARQKSKEDGLRQKMLNAAEFARSIRNVLVGCIILYIGWLIFLGNFSWWIPLIPIGISVIVWLICYCKLEKAVCKAMQDPKYNPDSLGDGWPRYHRYFGNKLSEIEVPYYRFDAQKYPYAYAKEIEPLDSLYKNLGGGICSVLIWYLSWMAYSLLFSSIGLGWYSVLMMIIFGCLSGIISMQEQKVDDADHRFERTFQGRLSTIFLYNTMALLIIIILTLLGFIWYYFCGGAFIGLFDDIFTNVAIGALSIFLILYVAVGFLGLFR